MICTSAYDLSVIDKFQQDLELGLDSHVLNELLEDLLHLRAELPPAEWREFCRGAFHHQLNPLLEDAAHAAVLHAWEQTLPAGRGHLNVRNLLTAEIREEVRATPRARILALGNPVSAKPDFSPYDHLTFCVDASPAETRQRLLAGSASDRFDLIYSVDWLDHSSDRQALSWLTDALALLRGSGRFLAANFMPGRRDAAYWEARLRRWPVYRNEEDLALLVSGLCDHDLRGHAVYRDETGATAFLELYAA